ncbi:hypothetical protein N9B82_06010 [Saprospiraceae bacterium]|nr:hypothetical protein [Saprospiraceae bacterium]
MRKLIQCIMLLFFSLSLFAQSGRIEKNERLFQLMQRYEIKYGHYDGFMGNSPLSREEVHDYFYALDSVGLAPKEEYDRNIVLQNLAENLPIELSDSKPWYRYFYENRAYLFDLKKKDFWISVNPIIYLKGGIENGDNYILQNTRGIRLKGALGKKVYFSSAIYENQASFLEYQNNRINRFKTISGQAFYKAFNFNIDNESYDFLNADGFVGLKINKFINAELGHGRHFIGHGIRSMLLSDYSTNYLYLRTNTRIWKFNYQNLFAELSPFTERLFTADSDILPKKYMAQHILSFKLNHAIELGIVETVIFSRINNFEFQYLNPIIFYRTVEQFLNSPDNVLIGAQGKWNITPGLQIYGQVIVDEFNLNQLREDINWWGNKVGIQAGAKYVDAFNINMLDLQLEFNAARPYLYTHNGTFEDTNISKANYSHFSQPLAHPLGANFYEFLANINYKITNRLTVNPRLLYTLQGIDPVDQYFGENILTNNGLRVATANQRILQGDKVAVTMLTLNGSYEFFPNYFADINLLYRNSISDRAEYNIQSLYFGAGIRFNFQEDHRDY